jgi:hydrogenase maturation protease
MSADIESSVPPLLVLGIGNALLADDGLGLALLQSLRQEFEGDARVELVDGGTQGMLLVGLLEGRRALLLLDAVQLGARPGQVHVELEPERVTSKRGLGAHGGNASELLASASILNILPERVVLVGIEPAEIHTGMQLSPIVRRALPAALAEARRQLLDLFTETQTGRAARCTS